MSWSFTGISYPVEATYTQGLGFRADVAMLRCLPQTTNLPAQGTLTLFWSSGITLPNCVVDVGSARIEARSQHIVLLVKDRRERWLNAAPVSGEYNVLRPLGRQQAKNLRQLTVLLLTALGETTADVSAVPTTEYPYVNWECESVVAAAEELLTRYGFSLSLGYDAEAVKIVRIGTGTTLSTTNAFLVTNTIDTKLIPRYVRSCFEQSVAQVRLKVSPVIQELDGEWVALEDCSFRPVAGWGGVAPLSTPEFADTPEYLYRVRGLRRAYIVSGFADETWNAPDGSGLIRGREYILPIQGRLLTSENLRDSGAYAPMKVYGKAIIDYEQEAAPAPPVAVVSDIGDEIVGRKYSFDGETGLLLFTDPIYYVDEMAYDAGYQPADLWIEVTIRVRDPDHFGWQHYEKNIEVAPSGLGWVTVKHEQRAETIIEYDSLHEVVSVVTNQTALDTIATDAAAAAAAAYAPTAAQFVVYNQPILSLRCDGAIQQVQHIMTNGEQEHAVNRTTASRFFEWDRGAFTRSEQLAYQLALSVAERNRRSVRQQRWREDDNE